MEYSVNEIDINEIDTSYWKIKNKEWMAERNEDWLNVETRILAFLKPKKLWPLSNDII